MNREDEIFRKLDKEKPIIKRRDGDAPRPQRRSIGRMSEEGFFSPAPVRERVRPESAADSARVSVNKVASAAATGRKTRLESETEKRAASDGEKQRMSAAPRQETRLAGQSAAASRREALGTSESPRTARQAPAARRVSRPAPASTVTRTDSASSEFVHAPERRQRSAEQVEPSERRGSGIMPPIPLKSSAVWTVPSKIETDGHERAPLINRHELKFYLNYADYVVLRQKMKGLLRTDEHAGPDGSYFIRSLYFDNMYDSAVTEKQAGVQFRHKYRIRIYNLDKGFIRFEKKIKTGQFISKDDFPLTYREYCALISGDIEFLLHKPQPLAKEVYLAMRQQRLRPCVVVDYDREPFVMNYETVRITFDRDVRTGRPSWDIFDPNLPVMPLLDKGTVIMEVKFRRCLPEHIRQVINSAEALQCSAVSKYIICRQYD